MNVTPTTKKHYEALKGKTIKEVKFTDMGDGGDPAPILVFTDGTEATVQCDPEGNGAGFLNIFEPIKCDQCSKWIGEGEEYFVVTQSCEGKSRKVNRCASCVEKKKVAA